MSKFKDKLTRLHASRVRALESEEPEAPRVFVAEPEEPSSSPPVSKPGAGTEQPKPASRSVERVDTPARKAVRDQLELGRRVRSKKPQRVRMQRGDLPVETAEPQTRRSMPPTSDNAIGERLTELRLRAEALIEVGGLESALPLLHEMAALSPTHTFPLTQLVAYWRSKGNEQLAELYAGRLSAVAPY